MSLATAGPAAATDGSPCARPQVYRANHWVQYCPLWRSNVPVYADPDHGNGATIVGRLVVGGSANWFVGDHYRSYFSDGGYYNHWWAYTLADNGRWGWVPEVYFSGGNNDETDGGCTSARLARTSTTARSRARSAQAPRGPPWGAEHGPRPLRIRSRATRRFPRPAT